MVESHQESVVDVEKRCAEVAGGAFEVVGTGVTGRDLDRLPTAADDDLPDRAQDGFGLALLERGGSRGALGLGLAACGFQHLTGAAAALSGGAEVEEPDSHFFPVLYVERCPDPAAFV